MGKLFAILGSIAYYLCYPFVLILVLFGPLMEFPVLLEIFRLGSPRAGITLGVLGFIGLLLFLSYKYPRLGWLYRKFPVLVPLLQMFFYNLIRNRISDLFCQSVG